MYRINGPGAPLQNLYSSSLNSVAALTVDLRKTNTIYAAGAQGLFRSTDAGATWRAIGNFDVPVDALAVDPSASNILYAATNGKGIFKSADGGRRQQSEPEEFRDAAISGSDIGSDIGSEWS